MKTIKMFLVISLMMLNQQLMAYCLDSEGTVRVGDATSAPSDCNGPEGYFSNWDIPTICPVGTHVPSAREYAKMAEARGANGIIEFDACLALVDQPDTYPYISYIKSYNERLVRRDEFCFDPKGFRKDENNWFIYWTSSTLAGTSNNFQYFGSGQILKSNYNGPNDLGAAIQCIPN